MKYFFWDSRSNSILGIRVDKPVGELESVRIEDLAHTDRFRDEHTVADQQDFGVVVAALEQSDQPDESPGLHL